MKMLLRLGALVTGITLLVFTTPVFSQAGETAPPAADPAENAAAEEARPSSSQEVEINEDTYRQFMELKDANRQGDIIPETTFKPGSGLQKLDKLPEESQKHLRNELREIIVQGDPWQPGDENADYPYTPSAAASKDPALQKQEMEAWGELVDSYNQREAQIYADRAGNRATTNPQEGQGDRPGSGAGQAGKDGEEEEGVPGQPSEQQSEPDRDVAAGAFSPDAVHDPNGQSASGVSQNALEFLQGLGGTGENQAGGQTGMPQGNQQGPAGTPGQAQTGQQGAARQAGNAAGTRSPAAGADSGTAGTSQSAMDYLNQAGSEAGSASADGSKGQQDQDASSMSQADGQQPGQDGAQSTAQNSSQGPAQGQEQAEGKEPGEQGEGQTGSQTEGKSLAVEQTATEAKTAPVPDEDFTFSSGEPEAESTVGTTQNALQFLQGESPQSGDVTGAAAETSPPPAGTLNIQDLLNAQGVSGAAGTVPENPASGGGEPADETKTGKDGGG